MKPLNYEKIIDENTFEDIEDKSGIVIVNEIEDITYLKRNKKERHWNKDCYDYYIIARKSQKGGHLIQFIEYLQALEPRYTKLQVNIFMNYIRMYLSDRILYIPSIDDIGNVVASSTGCFEEIEKGIIKEDNLQRLEKRMKNFKEPSTEISICDLFRDKNYCEYVK